MAEFRRRYQPSGRRFRPAQSRHRQTYGQEHVSLELAPLDSTAQHEKKGDGTVWIIAISALLLLALLVSPMYVQDLMLGGLWATLLCAIFLITGRWILPVRRRVVGIATAVLAIWLIANHVYMTFSIGPLKTKFTHVAATADNVGYSVGEGEEAYTALDYGGKLDAVIQERDEWLADRGFIYFLGRWQTGSDGTHAGGLYMHVGPLAWPFTQWQNSVRGE